MIKFNNEIKLCWWKRKLLYFILKLTWRIVTPDWDWNENREIITKHLESKKNERRIKKRFVKLGRKKRFNSLDYYAREQIIKALKKITEWQSIYDDETWEEEETDDWEYYVRSDCDDGPKMRIEKKELR